MLRVYWCLNGSLIKELVKILYIIILEINYVLHNLVKIFFHLFNNKIYMLYKLMKQNNT